MFDEHRRHTLANRRDRLPNLATAIPHVAGQRIPLGPPHAFEPIEGGVEAAGYQRPCLVDGVARRWCLHENAGKPEDAVDRPRGRDAVGGTEILEIIEIDGQLAAVEPATGGRSSPGHIERHLHGAAADSAADRGLDLRFKGRKRIPRP